MSCSNRDTSPRDLSIIILNITLLMSELLCQLFRTLRYQWISANIKVWHPWQLKKKIKSWGPCWSNQLNSTANLAHLPKKWHKMAKLAVLLSWYIQIQPPRFWFLKLLWVPVNHLIIISCPTRTKNLERYMTTLLLPSRATKLVKVRTVEWMRPDGSKRGQQKCVATYADYALYPYAAGCCWQLGQIAKTRHELDWKKIVKLTDPS